MKHLEDEPKVIRATEYFRDVEQKLRDLGSLYLKVCQGIQSLGEEFQSTVRKSALILYPGEIAEGPSRGSRIYPAVLRSPATSRRSA